jgi:hypothetical protein
MKAVRDAGRSGQPFTLGEVRAELGLKSRDKRELKRFRSRFRECSQILGAHLEKLGPNTYRLKLAGLPTSAAKPAAPAAASKGAKASKQGQSQGKELSALKAPAPVADDAAASRLIDRVGVSAGQRRDRERARVQARASGSGSEDRNGPGLRFDAEPSAPERSEDPSHELPRNTRAAAFAEQPIKLPPAAAPSGFGTRLSSWLGRVRGQNTNSSQTAATALSRLAVDLQPKAANFEYRWNDGKLQVKLTGQPAGVRSPDGQPRAADK